MAERHPAIDGENRGNNSEPLTGEIVGFERCDARLLFVVDVKVGGGGKDRAAFGGVPVAKT